MHWELWAVPDFNLIAAMEREAEALALVRELLAKGWRADHLSLIVEDEARPAEELPPALTGEELARRPQVSPSGRLSA